ncbi:MAG: hypothetical protein E6J91_25465 [Deltaproteobacteria bacterium]|nr:MAG: hypothetical protein E6J91_25465 [Deltaproteobacteria bacterium]
MSIAVVAVLGACGGPQVPTHNGYKPKDVAPWKQPKALKFDDKGEAKPEGDVSYPDMRRARWYELTLPSNGQLSIALEITPPGDAVNDDFDLGLEVLDPRHRVISKSELEDEDAHELNKKKTLVELVPGKYLIHIFLQGRMDTAEFALRVTFKATAAAEAKTNFPADVPFVPVLPMVPIQDDTPARVKVTTTPPPRGNKHHTPTPTPTPTQTAGAPVRAKVIGMQIIGRGTQIVVGKGTTTGAANGMKVSLAGVSSTGTTENCKEQTCSATITATPDQIRAAQGWVTLTP